MNWSPWIEEYLSRTFEKMFQRKRMNQWKMHYSKRKQSGANTKINDHLSNLTVVSNRFVYIIQILYTRARARTHTHTYFCLCITVRIFLCMCLKLCCKFIFITLHPFESSERRLNHSGNRVIPVSIVAEHVARLGRLLGDGGCYHWVLKTNSNSIKPVITRCAHWHPQAAFSVLFVTLNTQTHQNWTLNQQECKWLV